MPALERHVVRPKAHKLAVGVLGSVAFVALGGWLLTLGSVVGFVIGLLSIAFFGGAGLYTAVVSVRQGLAKMTLTPGGIELASGGTVPWQDVEAVAVVKAPTTVVAIRLRTYDRYLASLPAGGTRADGLARVLAPVAQLLVRGSTRGARLRDRHDELRWTRENYGFDLGFSPAWLDRPAAEFVQLLEHYRRGAAADGVGR